MDRWALVHKSGEVVAFDQIDEDDVVHTTGTLFIGTKAMCEAEIERLGLEFPEEES